MGLPLNKVNVNSGQSLLGILIAIAIFSILAHAVLTLTNTSYSFTSFNRARITAKHLAQERIELLRNLPYDDVGTIGGVPSGTAIPQSETVERNGLNFTIETSIIYVDDEYDGTQGGTPDDLLETDYKRARVEVSWEGLASSRKNPVVLVTDIAPRGVETTAGGGTLSIFVIDANGEPVSQADLTIIATSIVPQVNITAQTASNGRYILPGMQPCDTCYEVTVSKAGYTSTRTYSTSEIANPDKPHQTVLVGQRSEIVFEIDQLSTLNIASFSDRDSDFAPEPNVTFRIQGTTKILGTDALGENVYKVDEVLTTNASGLLNIDDLEWDTYIIFMEGADPWDISGTFPLLPLEIEANTTNEFSFAVTSSTPHNLLTTFVDNSGGQVASVSAIISDGLGFEQEVVSGSDTNPDFGQSFYANLSEITYDFIATSSGYINATGTIDVAGRTQETIILSPE